MKRSREYTDEREKIFTAKRMLVHG